MEIPLDRPIDLVGIGTSTLDRLYLVDAFPTGDCVYVPIAYAEMGGGPTATAICAAAALGGTTHMIDRIGDRPPPDLILGGYRRYGVNVQQVATQNGTTTGHASILVRQSDGARAITYQPGTARELDQGEVDLEVISQSKILHMNGRHAGLAMQAIEYAKNCRTLISFDGGAGRFRPESRTLFELADILIVSSHFAQAATGCTSIDAMLSELASKGASIVGITCGEAGSEFYLPRSGDRFSQAAVPARHVVDTTGCGDLFHGAFLYYLAQGNRPSQCAERAAAVAARNCEGLGGRFAIEPFERETPSVELSTGASSLLEP
jgi:sugar/nucleoside kinase (ribokinase family)